MKFRVIFSIMKWFHSLNEHTILIQVPQFIRYETTPQDTENPSQSFIFFFGSYFSLRKVQLTFHLWPKFILQLKSRWNIL